jgi:hypothetical protein
MDIMAIEKVEYFFGMKKPMELYIGQKINQDYFKIL